MIKYVNNNRDKSVLNHIQTILGLNSIKPQCDANKFLFEEEGLDEYPGKVSVLEKSKE